ncbi:MAG: 6-phosphofructokinase [Sphingomonadales bacterium]
MRIGILTGGGDVPGLNPCIKAVVTQASEFGWEVFGFRRGWAGPLNYNPDDAAEDADRRVFPLSPESVRTIGRTGGTVLHTSRTNPGRVRRDDVPAFLKGRMPDGENGTVDCTKHVLTVLDHLGIDALIPIGGDDTLSYAAHLHRQGVPVMAVPKTMDNDVFGTDYCIGFSTAVSRSVEYINALRTPTGSHERIAVIELFGRNSGETALISGYLADADRVLISEVPFDLDVLAELVTEDRGKNPSSYAIVVISEGASLIGDEVMERGEADAYGHRKLGGIGPVVGERLKTKTGLGIVSQPLAYLMRSGPPDSLDQMVANSYGSMAVQLLAQGKTGSMMALRDGNYTTVPVETCIQGVKRVDVDELYDVGAYRPKVRQVFDKPMFLY